MTAAEKMLAKALVGSKLDTKEWAGVQAGLRDRAFFMAQVEDARILHAARQGVADMLESGKSQSEVRRDIRRVLSDIGYDPDKGLKEGDPSRRGTIKDLLTERRLDVMIETNVGLARGYAEHLRATTEGALRAFPAYELVRVKQRKKPRDWDARWKAAAQAVGWEGVAKDGHIALKTSPIWTELSAFDSPHPPFDFNSGMGVDDVSRRECIKIGLIDEDTPPQKPPKVHLNGSLQAEVPFDNRSPEYSGLREKFGDFIQWDDRNHAVRWRENVFKENFDKGGKFTIRAGVASNDLLGKLPNGIDPAKVQGKHLTITQGWLDKKRKKDLTTDHRIHFANNPDEPDDIPLDQRDIEMLPSMWHRPDRTFESHGRLVLEVDALDGSIFRAVVDVEGNPNLKTFYRTKESWADYQKRLKNKKSAP